jgi:AraC-like DNA-binding protein
MLLPNYQKVYRNFCISYLGDSFLYPVILSNLRKVLEKKYENLNIFYCYDKIIYEKFKNKKNVINKSFLASNPRFFGFIYNLSETLTSSTIENLIDFGNLNVFFKKLPPASKKALLVKKNNINSLTEKEIEMIKIKMLQKGFYTTDKIENIKEIGAIVGLESPELFSAAFFGIPTFLFNKNPIHINVYKKLFVNQEILD